MKFCFHFGNLDLVIITSTHCKPKLFNNLDRPNHECSIAWQKPFQSQILTIIAGSIVSPNISKRVHWNEAFYFVLSCMKWYSKKKMFSSTHFAIIHCFTVFINLLEWRPKNVLSKNWMNGLFRMCFSMFLCWSVLILKI